MALLKFIAFRLLQAIPLLLAISLLSFLLLSLAPGDFLAEQRINPANSAEMIERLELDLGGVAILFEILDALGTRNQTNVIALMQ